MAQRLRRRLDEGVEARHHALDALRHLQHEALHVERMLLHVLGRRDEPLLLGLHRNDRGPPALREATKVRMYFVSPRLVRGQVGSGATTLHGGIATHDVYDGARGLCDGRSGV